MPHELLVMVLVAIAFTRCVFPSVPRTSRRAFFSAFACALSLFAQESGIGDKRIQPIQIGRRLALVIGNAHYQYQPPIPQAINDANDVASALRALGFQVTAVNDTHIGVLDRTLENFYAGIQPGDLALFYYSGHGGSLGEENYLLPVEFQQQETESGVMRAAAAMSMIRNRMEAKGARVRILIFDACRNAALVTAKDAASGLTKMEGKAEGTLIAYASAHGQVSRFSAAARNSFYTGALVQRLRTPRTDLRTLLEDTADDVYEETGSSQMPYLYGRLFGKLYLAATPSPEPPPQPPGNSPAPGQVKVSPKDGQRYVWIPPGSFVMGCSPGDTECDDDEKPAHEVHIQNS